VCASHTVDGGINQRRIAGVAGYGLRIAKVIEPEVKRSASGNRHAVGTDGVTTCEKQRYFHMSINVSRVQKASCLELLRAVLPDLRRLAVIANVSYLAAVRELAEVRTVARQFGIDVDVLEIRCAEDIAPAFGALKSGAQALYVCPDALVNANYVRINTLALGARLPRFIRSVTSSERGALCLMGQKIQIYSVGQATWSTRFSRGAKAADLPVEQPTMFELVNLTTAKALGLTVPEAIIK
jgi:putative ABC transport system substrate-binding protein